MASAKLKRKYTELSPLYKTRNPAVDWASPDCESMSQTRSRFGQTARESVPFVVADFLFFPVLDGPPFLHGADHPPH